MHHFDLVVGTDEAGYGPNLGPLVVTGTRWTLPTGADPSELWSRLAVAISPDGPVGGRLHVADSKQVYTPARGLAELERSVLALLSVADLRPRSVNDLRERLTAWRSPNAEEFAAPWYAMEDVPLPVAISAAAVDAAAESLRKALSTAAIQLTAIRSDVVSERRFNRLTTAAGSKGAVLTEATLAIASDLCPRDSRSRTLVLCDKHGGRNRYAGVLSSLQEDGLVKTLTEAREQSVYRAGTTEFRFETKAERHLPVAAASMVAKYLREVSMLAFNQFWRRHQVDLRETKGYPQDAKRFRADIAAVQQLLGVSDDDLWRSR